MSLFSKKEKPCSCGENCTEQTIKTADKKQNEDTDVKILGSGCSKCNALEAATVQALSELGLEKTIDHVKDFSQIASYGVMTTPALVYKGKVLSYGKVLKSDEIKILLKKEV